MPFKILHIPRIEALITIPIKKRCYVDLDRVQAHKQWVGSGDDFSLAIQVRDLTFVMFSAGEIILQIKNFPEFLIRDVMGTTTDVARTLYTDGKPLFRATVEDRMVFSFPARTGVSVGPV